jgi:hypothetical protein
MYSFAATVIGAITIVTITFVLLQHSSQVSTIASAGVGSFDNITNAFSKSPTGG